MVRLHRNLKAAVIQYRSIHDSDPYLQQPDTPDQLASCEEQITDLLARIEERPSASDAQRQGLPVRGGSKLRA